MKKILYQIAAILFAILICAAIVLAPQIPKLMGLPEAEPEVTLPQIHITGDISGMNDKTDVRNISVTYESDQISFDCYGELKVQGYSSLSYEKKNYTIKFFKDDTHQQKLKMDFGWGAQSKYCLKANWIDYTHSRNIVTANIVTEIQKRYELLEQAPANGVTDGFPVEMYLNGEFYGLYTINIPKDEWLLGMDSDNPDHIVFCGREWTASTMFYIGPNYTDWTLEVGKENGETLAKLNRLFDFVINSSDEDFREHFGEYMNLDAALNYCVLVDFAFLEDNLGKNMLLATYDGEIWYPILYDLDTSWGMYWDGRWVYEYKNMLVHEYRDSNFFNRMEKCFGKELSQRYFELREDILTEEYVLSQFEAYEASIPAEVFEKETAKWGNDIPGFPFTQIEGYFNLTLSRIDEKYQKLGR